MDVRIIQGKSLVTNTADALAGDLSVQASAYVDGGIYLIFSNAANTTVSPTLNINSLGVKSILRLSGSSIGKGDIQASTWYLVLYSDAVNAFILLNPHFGNGGYIDNTVFVSALGDDATGAVGRPDKTFLTISAAQSAASSGDTIIVYPGTYTVSGLGKAGVNWHFMNGAVLNSTTNNMWTDVGDYMITGEGEFTSTSGYVFNMTSTGVLTVHAKRASCTTGRVFNTSNSAKIHATFLKDVASTGAGGRNIMMTGSSEIYLQAKTVTNTGYAVSESDSATTKLYITANTITASGSLMFYNCGTLVVRGDMNYSGSSTAISISVSAVAYHKYYGNLVAADSDYAVNINNGSAGTFDFYGNINSKGPCRALNTSMTVVFHDDVLSSKSTSPTISIADANFTGKMKIKARVKNSDSNAASYGIDMSSTAGTLILDNATIVTGAGSAPSIYASSAKNALVLGSCMVNINKHVNITILAGTFTVNTSVE